MILAVFFISLVPTVDIVFVINADSAKKTVIFKKIQDAIKQIGDKFDVDRFHYSVVVYGSTTTKKEFTFENPIPFKEVLRERVNAAKILSGSNYLPNALKEAEKILTENPKRRQTSLKAIVVISDKSSGQTVSTLNNSSKPIHDQGIIVVASSVGGDPKRKELLAITTRSDDVIEVTDSDTSGYLGDRIVERILKGNEVLLLLHQIPTLMVELISLIKVNLRKRTLIYASHM